MKPHRIRMAHNLVLAYGLYKKLEIYRPTLMSEEQMTKFHADDYIHFLQHVTPDNQMDYSTELTRYNLDVGPPAYSHAPHPSNSTAWLLADRRRCCAHAIRLPDLRWHVQVLSDVHGRQRGWRLQAQPADGGHLRQLVRPPLTHTAGHIHIHLHQPTHRCCSLCILCRSGGLHHAKKSESSGFCYVNDIVLAILELLKYHQRVLYIDIDIHHGDGVEEAFYTTDRVMTVSFHKYGEYFPGTGSVHDTGVGAGKNYSLNFPLLDGMDDHAFEENFKIIISRVMQSYKPGAVVLQCGADSLSGDRLGCFNLSLKGHGSCVEYMKSFNVPLLLLGGGGYTVRNVARCFGTDTRVLTDHGFLFVDEIELLLLAGKQVKYACYDKATDTLVYGPGRLVGKPNTEGLLYNMSHPLERAAFAAAAAAASAGPSRTTTPISASADGKEEVDEEGNTSMTDEDADDDEEEVDEKGQTSNHFSLRVTGDHELYVQVGINTRVQATRVSVNKGGDGKAHEAPFDKMQVLDAMKWGVTRQLSAASGGVAVPAGALAAQLAPLELTDRSQIAAFLELYGFWLGNGSMRYSPVRGGRCIATCLRFKQAKATDNDWLRRVLPAAGLVEGLDWKEGAEFTLMKPSWVRLFNTEYWRHYMHGVESTNRDADGHTAEKIKMILSLYSSSGKWLFDWVLLFCSLDDLRLIAQGIKRADGNWKVKRKQGNRIFTSSPMFRDQLVQLV